MKIVSNGKMIEIPPRGPAGPDGNPIGTVISYLGQAAPKDYLTCDGAVYPVSEYPELAEFFQEQFGAVNYFGGDGATDFAVPDMRNLFLRGYHGEAEESLSGEIGVKQDATVVPYFIVDTGFVGYYGYTIYPNNEDTYLGERDVYYRVLHNSVSSSPTTHLDSYTTRPVNMSVLYCIKARKSFPAKAVYSTEEQRIGTWIDGKPIYKKTILHPQYDGGNNLALVENVDTVVNAYGTAMSSSKRIYHIPVSEDASNRIQVNYNGTDLVLNSVGFGSYSITITVEYTKTTD